MSYPINYPTPQGANVQMFSQGGSSSDWVKPQGASFVWFTLIGPGGRGSDVGGQISGGSGAVTNFMCPAFLIPDILRVNVGREQTNASSIVYQQKDGTGYTLLTADFGKSGFNASGLGGSAMTANAFTAMGFFQSVAGQDGVAIGSGQGPSATTFLSSGSGSGSNNANYGYLIPNNNNGGFMLQPMIVGIGGSGSSSNGRGGIGCGGNASAVSVAGNGLVVIITW